MPAASLRRFIAELIRSSSLSSTVVVEWPSSSLEVVECDALAVFVTGNVVFLLGEKTLLVHVVSSYRRRHFHRLHQNAYPAVL